MAEYIEREAVVKAFCESCSDYIDNKCTYEGGCETSVIDTVPTADVQPVKRGKWEENHDWINCSICGFDVKDEYYAKRFTYKYCPKCGAQMLTQG